MRALASFLAVGLTLVAFAAFPDDASTLRTLAEGGRYEVEAGELAGNKGTSDEVKKFGMMMVKDHGAGNEKVKNLAKAKGVALPETMGAEKTELLNKLRSQEQPRFDAEYLAQQVSAHEKTRELLKSEIAGSGSGDVKALAQDLLPTVEKHLAELYRLTGQAGKAASLQTKEP